MNATLKMVDEASDENDGLPLYIKSSFPLLQFISVYHPSIVSLSALECVAALEVQVAHLWVLCSTPMDSESPPHGLP